MEPRLTETLRYFFLAMLLILASQGIAQSLPKTTNSPNTEIEATIAEAPVSIEFTTEVANEETLMENLIDAPTVVLDDNAASVTYFKFKRIAHKTRFAEESLFRKSYIA